MFMQVLLAAATSVQVFLVHVPGPDGLTRDQTLQMFNEAKAVYEHDVGITLTLAKFVSAPDHYTTTLSNRRSFLRRWEGFFKRYSSRSLLNMVVLPPINEGGKLWLTGYSNSTCSYGKSLGVAYTNGLMFN